MDSLHKLEAMVASWYKNAPHLPIEAREWIATNAWWMVLVGVILNIIALWGLMTLLFFASAVLVGYAGIAGAALGGILWVASLIVLIFGILIIILAAMAVKPLKVMRKKGWMLLFIILLIEVVSQVVDFLFKFNLFGLVWGVLWAGVGAYFLFEVRDYFGIATTDRKVAHGKSEPKKAA